MTAALGQTSGSSSLRASCATSGSFRSRRSGAAKIQNVLEYPADSTLLDNFNNMLISARCRPASHNGRAVDSHLVLSFSKISVYD